MKRVNPRSGTFLSPALRLFAKTGSLGGRFIMEDCGVLIDPVSDSEIAHFGYGSVGWRLPALTAETAGGLIGVEIARMLGLNPVLNADYTPEAEALLMGDSSPDAAPP